MLVAGRVCGTPATGGRRSTVAASTHSGRGPGMVPPRPRCAMIFVPPHGNMHLSALGIGFVALAWHTCDHRAPCDHRACSACSWHCALCPRDRQVCGSLAAACSWQTTWHGSLWPSGHASWRTELWSPHRVQCSLVLVAWQRPCPRDWPVLGSPTAACGAQCWWHDDTVP